MEWTPTPTGDDDAAIGPARRWRSHAGHGPSFGPHRLTANRWSGPAPAPLPRFAPMDDDDGLPPSPGPACSFPIRSSSNRLVELDGADGEGGGQILRTALTLAMLTGRPFRISRIRANRDRPGLRPQHRSAVMAAAKLSGATVQGATVGSHALTFRPRPFEPTDLDIDIGTAGSTCLVLQTLALPIALRADRGVRVSLTGGTFNLKAPSFPFLDRTWRAYLKQMGLDLALAMPEAGFYPQGGGRLDAWIEPGTPRPLIADRRGALVRISGVAGACKLDARRVADRMRDRAVALLNEAGLDTEIAIDLAHWSGPAPGAAIALVAEHDSETPPSTFVGLGARGKPAEEVAAEAVAELLDHLHAPGQGAVDFHSADQLLLPLALAEGRSLYTVSRVTEHLRTNIRTIAAFLDRRILLEEPDDGDGPGRVIVG
ncbi:RNA 3'-terminal phosphate cyclase [Tautonia marina]|uniref:RNA 3'-terminal phosphate cyclase n=1 Tax=Tautonia marina TaxID=2653855 RepID=UPI001260ED75|nr:RNA 3'-terminal phosphate cyclase [Tautonia marina]